MQSNANISIQFSVSVTATLWRLLTTTVLDSRVVLVQNAYFCYKTAIPKYFNNFLEIAKTQHLTSEAFQRRLHFDRWITLHSITNLVLQFICVITCWWFVTFLEMSPKWGNWKNQHSQHFYKIMIIMKYLEISAKNTC